MSHIPMLKQNSVSPGTATDKAPDTGAPNLETMGCWEWLKFRFNNSRFIKTVVYGNNIHIKDIDNVVGTLALVCIIVML